MRVLGSFVGIVPFLVGFWGEFGGDLRQILGDLCQIEGDFGVI